MYVQIKNGKRIAVHHNPSIRHSVHNESPRHKALKERIATAARRAGFEVRLEDEAADGLRRTDVLIRGADGLLLGCEVQVSHITPDKVVKRAVLADRDGIVPMWTVDDAKAAPIDRAPWARIDHLPWELIMAGDSLNVRGGVKTLRMERCDKRRATPCPDRGRGRCGQWHGYWDPTLGLRLDEIITQAGAGELVPLYQPKKTGGGWHMWVTRDDKIEFLQGRPEPIPRYRIRGTSTATARPQLPKALDPACHYGEESTIRGTPRGARDTGERVDASTWVTRSSEPPTPSPIRVVDGYRIPGDLIALRVAFQQAQQHCSEISDELPSGRDIIAGTASISSGLAEQVEQARAEATRLALAIHAHPWWAQVDNRYQADQAVRNATRNLRHHP